jgi:hypothetical protein
MRRWALLAVLMTAALAIPAGAEAKPTKQDKANAAKECKALRGTTDESREAFKAKYKNLGACVSEKAREQAAQRRAAKRHAARECRTERSEDPAAFAEKYGNFGKCVSSKAKEKLKATDREDREEIAEAKNAAKECAQERETLGDKEFEDKYGTNHNKRNAFGKCVSGKEKDDADEGEQPPTG